MDEQLKKLTAEFENIGKRIGAIPEEIILMEKRMKEREINLNQVLRDIEEARQKRQKILVSGGRVEPVSQSIKTLWERCDLFEDEVLGLKGKIRDLHSEKETLIGERDLCQNGIIRERIKPFIMAINRPLEEASNALKGLLAVMDEYDLRFGPEGWGKFISPSSWISLRALPRLSMSGESAGEDFINFTEIYWRRDLGQMDRFAQAITDARKAK